MDIATRAITAREHIDVVSLILSVSGDEVRIASDKAEAANHDVVVVAYDPREQVVKVGAGPNKKKKLAHKNVAVTMMKIGDWNGGSLVLKLPVVDNGRMESVVFVQAGVGGPIVAVAKV